MPFERISDRKENGTPILEEDEKVLFVEQNTQVFFDGPPYNAEGKGDLYVTDRNIIWLDSSNTSNGVSINMRMISMHALSRDTTYFPSACIYCQCDLPDDSLSEVRFVPQNQDALADVYEAFSKSAELNPDPEDDSNEGAGDFMFDMSEVHANMLTTENLSNGMEGVQLNGIVPGQFDDADEDDEYEGDEEESKGAVNDQM